MSELVLPRAFQGNESEGMNMKTIRHRCEIAILIFLSVFGLILFQPAVASADLPPVAAPLVREGDYAVRLAYALRVTTTDNELEAESRLADTGISPRNGWMADYPVTPDIIAELQNAIAAAADSGRLVMNRDDALRYMADVNRGFGLSVYPVPEGYSSGTIQPTPDQSIIDSYYSNVGPPVVTYYPPPSAYISSYAWVPSPFWWAGWWFPGFYILCDFHRPIIFPHRTVYISNRFWDRQDRHFHRVDPILRSRGAIHAHVDMPQARPSNLGGYPPARERGAMEKMDQRTYELRRPNGPGQAQAIPTAPDVKRNSPPPRPGITAESPRNLEQSRKPDRPEVRPESRPPANISEPINKTAPGFGRVTGAGAGTDSGRQMVRPEAQPENRPAVRTAEPNMGAGPANARTSAGGAGVDSARPAGRDMGSFSGRLVSGGTGPAGNHGGGERGITPHGEVHTGGVRGTDGHGAGRGDVPHPDGGRR